MYKSLLCGSTLVSIVSGGLVLAIEGPSKAEIEIEDNGDDTCSVVYKPTAAGEYNIIIRLAEQEINGSPFTAKILPLSMALLYIF